MKSFRGSDQRAFQASLRQVVEPSSAQVAECVRDAVNDAALHDKRAVPSARLLERYRAIA